MADKVLPEWTPFGTELRRLRKEQAFSQGYVGRRLSVTGAMIGHFERATRPPNYKQMRKLDQIFSLKDSSSALPSLWEEATRDHSVAPWFRDVLEVERKSEEIRVYEPILVPGLLQIGAYARALVDAWHPRIAPHAAEAMVEARISRLPQLLDRGARPLLWFVVDEIVITRPIGGRGVFAEQLRHIATLIEEGTIRFQVLPTGTIHPALCPPYRLMTLSERNTLLYVEHAYGGHTERDPKHVGPMMGRFGAIQADAMSREASLARLREAEKEMRDA
ncbi:helix-turn-helix domain-containing protein [Nocardiopsis coralliicola]